MTAKFKIGDIVHFKNYECTFKIKKTMEFMEDQTVYGLAIIPPVPKNLIWLPLIIRAKFANGSELTLTHQQKQKNRIKKLNSLLK